MSIYIRNMEMPENCHECPLVDTLVDCPCREMPDDVFWKPNSLVATSVHKDCPLIPVQPHGDLIDRDELSKIAEEDYSEAGWWFESKIEEAPTIIPASEEAAK